MAATKFAAAHKHAEGKAEKETLLSAVAAAKAGSPSHAVVYHTRYGVPPAVLPIAASRYLTMFVYGVPHTVDSK